MLHINKMSMTGNERGKTDKTKTTTTETEVCSK